MFDLSVVLDLKVPNPDPPSQVEAAQRRIDFME